MEYQPYLIIELHETRYGINAYAVQEIFFLPEITLIPESPLDVVGVINLRGNVLPIVDLHRRFGFPSQPYKLSDSVVVVANAAGEQVGLIVNRTYTVQSIDTANITQAPGHHGTDQHRFVVGIAKLDTELITLLHADLIVRYGTLLVDFTDPVAFQVAAGGTEGSGPGATGGGQTGATGQGSIAHQVGQNTADPGVNSGMPANGTQNHGMQANGTGANGPQTHGQQANGIPDPGRDRSATQLPAVAPRGEKAGELAAIEANRDEPTARANADFSRQELALEAEFWRKAQAHRATTFFAHATPEEREILLKRARNLRNRAEETSFSGLAPYAVVGLQGELFALGLEVIYEFTDVADVTPVPCCPPHIVGNLNLRGEILTLVDISGILNLPSVRSEQSHKAIVTRSGQLVAGITVDDVFDVIYLRSADISPIPAAIHSLNDEYIRGVAPYQKRQMSILDLPKLLTSPTLVVDEVVV